MSVALAGCIHSIRPPADVRDPVSVFVADYGYHAGLILPRGDAQAVEWAYGQWDWFVLNRDEWYRAPGAVLMEQPAALGSREIYAAPTAEELEAELKMPLTEVEVESSLVEGLRSRLDAIFNRPGASKVYNPKVLMAFVPYPQPYSGSRNCNTMVADWLRELGCDVTGGGSSSSFRSLK